MNLAACYQSRSLAHRRRRHAHFLRLLAPLLAEPGRTVHVLDVGGTRDYWTSLGGVPAGVRVFALNPAGNWFWTGREWRAQGASSARSLSDAAMTYDVAFSNSTLAYVGHALERWRLADNLLRLAPRLYLQTPNKFFPLDWRTCLPFFHWLPETWRATVMALLPLHRLPLVHDWRHWGRDYWTCLRHVREVEDVGAAELRLIFPGAKITRERVLGCTKSFIVTKGF